METQKSDVRTTRTFLLRMSNEHYLNIKAESQRVNVSMTAMLNFIIDDFVKRQKIEDGTEQENGGNSLRDEGRSVDDFQEQQERGGQSPT